MQSNSDMAGRALRVLALAYRDHSDTQETAFDEAEPIFAGLVGMIDPPRKEAGEAVRRSRAAGIRLVMITGDHPETAMAIAHELHIAGEADRVVTGQELNALSDEELTEQMDRIAVYARVSAEHAGHCHRNDHTAADSIVDAFRQHDLDYLIHSWLCWRTSTFNERSDQQTHSAKVTHGTSCFYFRPGADHQHPACPVLPGCLGIPAAAVSRRRHSPDASTDPSENYGLVSRQEISCRVRHDSFCTDCRIGSPGCWFSDRRS